MDESKARMWDSWMAFTGQASSTVDCRGLQVPTCLRDALLSPDMFRHLWKTNSPSLDNCSLKLSLKLSSKPFPCSRKCQWSSGSCWRHRLGQAGCGFMVCNIVWASLEVMRSVCFYDSRLGMMMVLRPRVYIPDCCKRRRAYRIRLTGP